LGWGLRLGLDVGFEFPVPVIHIAKVLGIEVVGADMDVECVFESSAAQIVVSVRRPFDALSQRFAIARELGQCLGHEELEVIQFAVNLLAPMSKVEELYRLGLSFADMGHYLQVPLPLLAFQLEKLGVL